ncbi:hypothetical protein [Lacicoccus qingdaonensis]|uniref:HEAT repeat-containing protein n=1 Tax=Lacicoccus qingdaonensis TaxID=576118 RepID=A0A1G9IR35_9BACL|nr:hypothetical protein [Salinicoccus qingdaonensis]SDL27443.1 hypothetical protein SAMN05216216_13616 [Salinicoccus qingdaonensis]
MNLTDKIEPHLTSEDTVVRQFALEAVSTYPSTKREWPVRLMNKVLEHPEETINYSSALMNMTLTSEIIPLLVEGIEEGDDLNKLLLKRLAARLPLEVKIENREALQNVFSMEEWSFLTELDEAKEEKLELWLVNHQLRLELSE